MNNQNLKNELQKAESWLSKEYSQVHTGRATPTVLDSVFVESYGAMTQIKNIASISIEEARSLRVSPWDKSQIKQIEKAISSANIGLSVATDDQGLRVVFPQLTTETRVNLVKVLKEKLEQARVMVRNTREEALDDINRKEKEGNISEDDKFRQKEAVQKEVDITNKNLESIFEKFENNVMSGEK